MCFLQVVVTEDNVMDIASQVVALTEDVTALTDIGILSVADLFEKVAGVISNNTEVMWKNKISA